MLFEWDDRKNRLNVQQHGISFEDAAKVFEQPTLTYFDRSGPDEEDRYIAIGFVDVTLATVVFVQRGDQVTRIDYMKSREHPG